MLWITSVTLLKNPYMQSLDRSGVPHLSKTIQFLVFLFMTLSAFWCIRFLVSIIPYWITMGSVYGIIRMKCKENQQKK